MKKKILTIEDNPQMRHLLRDYLEISGYEVLESETAKDGTKLAVKERPDLILIDVRLPYKKRGIGIAKILRKIEGTRDIPIIFVTAYPMWENSEEVKSISNCGYLIKPFERSTLIEYIERYVR